MSNEPQTGGWFKATRSADALELIRTNPNAFVLAFVIAHRSKWHNGFSADNLQPGEALLGDYQNCGMTEREYRTAKMQLTKWNFATFKTTNKGTIGKLIDTRLFNQLNILGDGQKDRQETGEGRTNDRRRTTNKEYRIKEGKNLRSNSSRFTTSRTDLSTI